MSDRIHKTVPQSSVIGMLLQTHEKFRVVQSEKTGLAQHDPFSWAIENGDFLYLKDLNWSAVYLDKTLNTWIEQMKKEEREIFIRTLFSLLTTGDVKTTGELKRRWTETAPVAFASYFTMEPEKREMLKKIMGQLVSIAAQKVPEVIDERMEK